MRWTVEQGRAITRADQFAVDVIEPGQPGFGEKYSAWVAWVAAQCRQYGIKPPDVSSKGGMASQIEVERLLVAGLPPGHVLAVIELIGGS